jgi:putative addiction module component (TIGR02574 family)
LGGIEEKLLMTRSVVELFREASDLEEGDRATLAGLLLESLEGEPDPDVEAAWAKEIDRRVRQLDAGEVDLVPWEDVKERLLKPLEKRR